jgi:hypothetical protein
MVGHHQYNRRRHRQQQANDDGSALGEDFFDLDLPLFQAKKINTHLVDQLQSAPATACYAGQWIFGY